jgi:subtilase family serine protease
MKVVVDDLEIQVKNISYRQKLEIQGEFADVYKNGTDNVKQREFNSLLGRVAEIAFVNPDQSLKKYEYEIQLKILTQAMMDYLELSDQSKKIEGD